MSACVSCARVFARAVVTVSPMLVLGVILLIVGLIWIRPLAWIGGVLIIIGLILWLAAVPGPVGGHYY